MKRCILMHPLDEVATALENISKGEITEIYDINNCLVTKQLALEDIPFGNKIALKPKRQGEKIIKYGNVIGETTKEIRQGTLVHVHNVKSLIVDIPPAFKKEIMRQMNIEI